MKICHYVIAYSIDFVDDSIKSPCFYVTYHRTISTTSLFLVIIYYNVDIQVSTESLYVHIVYILRKIILCTRYHNIMMMNLYNMYTLCLYIVCVDFGKRVKSTVGSTQPTKTSGTMHRQKSMKVVKSNAGARNVKVTGKKICVDKIHIN